MIRSSHNYAVFSWTYKTYKSIIAVDTENNLMETNNKVYFERLTKAFDILSYYNFQEGPKLNLLNISTIQSKHGIIIDQTYHTINNIIQ